MACITRSRSASDGTTPESATFVTPSASTETSGTKTSPASVVSRFNATTRRRWRCSALTPQSPALEVADADRDHDTHGDDECNPQHDLPSVRDDTRHFDASHVLGDSRLETISRAPPAGVTPLTGGSP